MTSADRPMWCDDFDMDLPKVIPEARGLVGELGDILLSTTCTSRTSGTLNHPCVWNGDDAMLAFFGFRSPARPAHLYTSAGEVRCTVWEAFRDAWPHHYRMLVERRAIWDTGALWREFEILLWDARGWGEPNPVRVEHARTRVRDSLRHGVALLRTVAAQHQDYIERLSGARHG